MSQQTYSLPDYTSPLTPDFDVYLREWKELAAPIEQKLGLTLSGFDPDFSFTKDNPRGPGSVTIQLPVWFVRDLSQQLKG